MMEILIIREIIINKTVETETIESEIVNILFKKYIIKK